MGHLQYPNSDYNITLTIAPTYRNMQPTISDEFTCAICMDIVQDACQVNAACGHLFCQHCLETHQYHHAKQQMKLGQQEPTTFPCPTCRNIYSSTRLVPWIDSFIDSKLGVSG